MSLLKLKSEHRQHCSVTTVLNFSIDFMNKSPFEQVKLKTLTRLW